MKSKTLRHKALLLGNALLAAASPLLGGCTLDPYIISAEEAYTRNFIKSFGLIDPEQDWNLAKEATVEVNLGQELCPSVKIYARHHGKYYLVADLTDLSGRVEVPVDVTESCTDIMVMANGRKFYGTLGEPIDCSDPSRGIPGADYTVYDNPNPAVYTASTAQGYAVSVKHTMRGNGADTGYGPDKGEYQYFNTQQISPLISTTPWDTYYSINTKKWTDNPSGMIGLLPESGQYNRPKEVLDKWLSDKKAEGQSLVEDFRIHTGDDGSFTLFPYYYGTNLKHELGVYLLDDKGNPILKNGTYNSNTDYDLKDFISFPVFCDRDPGDLQVQPHYDSAISAIWLEKDGKKIDGGNPLILSEGDVVRIQDYVKITRGGVTMSYDQYLEKYGHEYHSRVGYHIWVDRVHSKDDARPITYATCTNDGEFTALHSTAALENQWKWAQLGIATGLGSYKPGKGIVNGVQENFPYKIIGESPVKSISVSPSSVEIPVRETVTLDVTLYDKDNNKLDLATYFNDLNVTDNWYPDNIRIYKDEADKKIKIEAISVRQPDKDGNTSMWPQIYVGEAPGENSSNKVTCGVEVKVVPGKAIVDVPHSYSMTYSAANDAMSTDSWNAYFEYFEKDRPEVALGADITLGQYYASTDFASSLFQGIDDAYLLSVKLNLERPLQFLWGGNKEASFDYLVDGERFSSDANSTVTAKQYDIILTETMIDGWEENGWKQAGLKDNGLKIVSSCGEPELTVIEEIKLIADPEAKGSYLWTADGKAQAKAKLESYYNAHVPGEVSCSCGESHAFSSATAQVEILDDAAYDKISYRVTWSYTTQEEREVTKAAPRYKAPAKRTAAGSRAADSTPEFLKSDREWQDVSTFWSRFLPGQEEVASYPSNMCMLARSRGYDVTITYGTDENGNPKPWVGNLGVYLHVIGSYDADDSGDSGTYTDYVQAGTDYMVFSQKRFNRTEKGEKSQQVSALSVKHPASGRTFLTFEDMRVTHYGVTPDEYWEYSSDRDVNDLIFNITNYGGITNDEEEIKEDDDPDDETFTWLWAVEDLGDTDDFDFNDLVMKITSVTRNAKKDGAADEDGSGSKVVTLFKKVTFEPLCAGGTLPLYVHYNPAEGVDYTLAPGVYKEDGVATEGLDAVNLNNLVVGGSDSEIHRWFGDYAYTTMINTSGSDMKKASTCVIYLDTTFTIGSFGKGQTLSGKNGGLYVTVKDDRAQDFTDGITSGWEQSADDESWAITSGEKGKPAQMFMIVDPDVKWRWPKERVHILDAYPSFKEWTGNSRSDQWYILDDKKEGYTCPRVD